MLRVIIIGCVCGFLLMMFLSGGLAYAFSGGVIMPGPLKFTEKELLAAIKGGGYGLALGLIIGVILGYLKPQISGWLVGGVVGFAALGIIGGGYVFLEEHSRISHRIFVGLVYGLGCGLAGAILGSLLGGVIGILFNNDTR